MESKIFILRNCTNLLKADLSSLFAKVFITPDLTPTEREANQQLHLKLKEMNKNGNRYNGNCYKIKKREDSAEEGLDPTPTLINTNPIPLKLFLINFQSVLAKRAELFNLIHEHQPDVIFGTETWLSPNINSTEFFPAGYSLFRKDRSDGYGGVLLAFKKDLTVIEYEVSNVNECELVACTLNLEDQRVIICSIYRPPSSDISYTKDLITLLEDIAINNPTASIWIGGDINLPNVDWNNSVIVNNSYPLAICNTILDFAADYVFTQTVSTPTRNQNILLTNRPSAITSCEVIPGISDHEIISISTSAVITHSKTTEGNVF